MLPYPILREEFNRDVAKKRLEMGGVCEEPALVLARILWQMQPGGVGHPYGPKQLPRSPDLQCFLRQPQLMISRNSARAIFLD